MKLLSKPSIHLNKSLTRLKSDLCWNIKLLVLSAKFDNVSSTFFRIPTRSKFLYPSDCTRTVKLLSKPSIHLNKSLTRLKSDLCWNIKCEFLSAKFDNVSSTFFVYQLGQNFFTPQTVLGQWNSSLNPQFIWISPWLGWKAIYVETLNG